MTDDARSRRRFLRGLGSAAALGGVAGCSTDEGTPPERTSPPEGTATAGNSENSETDGSDAGESAAEATDPDDRPSDAELADRVGTRVERVVDVTEAGASPDGDEPIDPVLDEVVGDRTLLYFPPGEYLVTDTWRHPEFVGLALVGDDATIRPEPGFDTLLLGLGGESGASGLAVHGLTFDLSAEDTGARPLLGMVEDGLEVVDVTVTGRIDVDQDCLRFDVTDADGTGVVRNVTATDGGIADYPITGCYVGEASEGELRFVDCEFAGFPDNGLYASAATGPVIVEGGTYHNNDVSNVRVSGPARVSGATVRCDRDRDGFQNMRGIRLREGSDVVVEDCRIEMHEVAGSDGAVTLANWLDGATIRNTDIRVDADGVHGIWAKSPEGSAPSDREYRLRIEDVAIAGSAAGGTAVRLSEREDCLIDGACVRQTGDDRDGIVCTRVSDSTIRNSSIAVHGEPVVLEDASVDRLGVRTPNVGDGGGEGCLSSE